MKERNPARCLYHTYSATSVTFVSKFEIETPNYIFLVFYPCVIYKNVDIVFIEIYRIYPLSILKVNFLKSKETFISFNNKQRRHWKDDAIGQSLFFNCTCLYVNKQFDRS
jgi:hypothetical protein